MASTVQDVVRDELDALLSQYDARIKAAQSQKEQMNYERDRFMERFAVLSRTDWARCMEEVADKLGSAGHRTVVQLTQERYQESLTMKIEPNSNTPFAPTEDCYIRITPNEATLKVSFRTVSVGSMEFGHNEDMYALEDLTPQRMRQLLVRGVAQILQSTLPR